LSIRCASRGARHVLAGGARAAHELLGMAGLRLALVQSPKLILIMMHRPLAGHRGLVVSCLFGPGSRCLGDILH